MSDSFLSGKSPSISTSSSSMESFRIILTVMKSELITPDTFLKNFLTTQSETLAIIIYGWSFVILVSTIGLAIVTGNYIFYNLKTLSGKL
jgi:hypothetical protein